MSSSSSSTRQIARAAGVVILPLILSNLIGLLAKSLAGRAFGTTGDYDAFFAANRFSETLYNLVAGGALGSAFIPTFTTLLTRQHREQAWRLASGVANLLLVVTCAVSALAALFAPWVVSALLAPGFDPAQQALTVQLLRVQLLSVIIFGVSGLSMGILNAHQSFLLPALAPSMYSLGIIVGILAFAPAWGIFGMAWGVVLGAGMHLLVQLPALLRLPGRRYTFDLGLRNTDVREVILLMGPRILGAAAVQLNFWVNTLIGSGLAAGSVTAINQAFALMLMPQAAIAQSVATAALPTFSAQVARGERDEMRQALAAILRGVLLLSIPATVGLILLRRPIVALVYQRGAFTAASTELVSWALLWYAAGLVGHSLVEVLARSFYALHDTRTPVGVGVAAMALNAGLSWLLARAFAAAGWPPHGGLALANSLATALEAATLLVLMRRRLSGIGGGAVLHAAGQALLASLGMGAALWALGVFLPSGQVWLQTGVGIAAGGAAYALLLALLRNPELNQVIGFARRRLSRRA